jgi:hypothetical protein
MKAEIPHAGLKRRASYSDEERASADAATVRNLLDAARRRARTEARAALKGKDLLDVLKYAAGEMKKDVRARERRGR